MLIFLFRHFLHLPPTFLQQSLLKSLNFIKCDKLLSNNETFFPETWLLRLHMYFFFYCLSLYFYSITYTLCSSLMPVFHWSFSAAYSSVPEFFEHYPLVNLKKIKLKKFQRKTFTAKCVDYPEQQGHYKCILLLCFLNIKYHKQMSFTHIVLV